MLSHCFTCTEASGDCRRTALGYRENRVDYTLTRDKRFSGRESLFNRSRISYGPLLQKRKLRFVTLFVLDFCNRIVYGVFAVGHYLGNGTRKQRTQHYFMCYYRRFRAFGVNIAAGKCVADFNL